MAFSKFAPSVIEFWFRIRENSNETRCKVVIFFPELFVPKPFNAQALDRPIPSYFPGRKGVVEVPSILNKRRFTAKIRSLTDERRSDANLLKATVPETVEIWVWIIVLYSNCASEKKTEKNFSGLWAVCAVRTRFASLKLHYVNPRPAGGGAFERPPPLRFFEDSKKTAAHSAAGFSPTLSPIFSATFVKISTQCHVRSGHQVRSSDPTTK